MDTIKKFDLIILPTLYDMLSLSWATLYVCAVLEWTGDHKNVIRSALIEIQSDNERCALVMLSASKTSTLRTVDLLRHDKLLIWTSADKQRNYLLIHVPREYDLVSLCNYYTYYNNNNNNDYYYDILLLLLQCCCCCCCYTYYRIFGENMDKSLRLTFLGHHVRTTTTLYLLISCCCCCYYYYYYLRRS